MGLQELYASIPKERRFGHPELLAAIRRAEEEAVREEERERRLKLGHLCRECDLYDSEWKRMETCSACDGEGEVQVDCEHEGVELEAEPIHSGA